MSRFYYSDEELEINKVLKMNRDISRTVQTDGEMARVRSSADTNITSSIALLELLDRKKETEGLEKRVKSYKSDNTLKQHLEIESWQNLVSQANLHETGEVALEDIVSEAEIQEAFKELEDIESRFSKKTSIINKTDLSFLTIATALQVVKSLIFPYIANTFDYGKGFDPLERLPHDDKKIERAYRNANDKFRDKYSAKYGKGYWVNILYQTVPYDITKGSKNIGINMGGKYHRMYTLGHDPILGWFFGTANILTDCITFNHLQTNRISRIDPLTGVNKMMITPEIVPLGTMIYECYHMVKADPINLPAAIFAQAQHLKFDEFTKVGLVSNVIKLKNLFLL